MINTIALKPITILVVKIGEIKKQKIVGYCKQYMYICFPSALRSVATFPAFDTEFLDTRNSFNSCPYVCGKVRQIKSFLKTPFSLRPMDSKSKRLFQIYCPLRAPLH